jgi:pseudaminic acid cytidylyltransferase
MQTIAIIPARGGSKRIPRKNIRSFCGKPMIARSIEAALESGVFDAVVVSTDDDEIASIAESCGAEVPFRRPSELSNDHAATMPVMVHALNWWELNKSKVEFLFCIYATAPFLKPKFLQESLIQLKKTNHDFILSITSYEYPIQRSLKIIDEGLLGFAEPKYALTRSQDLEERYHDAGLFFGGKAEAFLKHQTTMSAKTVPYLIPRTYCQDIDNQEDWDHAANLFDYLQNR